MSLLQSELLNFIAHGKKRNSELRQAAEKSLAELGALPNTQDLSELSHSDDFVSPFLLACTASNAKSCASALQCLQILISLHGLSPNRLNDVLDALREAISLGVAIQLKVLQLLPLLLSEHFETLKGDLLAKELRVCAELGRDQKATMVSNTAYATLQQLITFVFENVDQSDGKHTLEVNTQEFQVNDTVFDAGRILLDLCITDKQSEEPQFLQIRDLPPSFTLELFELTLTNHAQVFHTIPVFKALLSQKIVPLLLRLFSESANEFSLIVRVSRLFYLLVRKHLTVITVEAEVILNTLAQNCKSSNTLWKQILCLEVYQGVLSDTSLVLQIFTQYRRNSSSTLQDAIECFSAALVKSNIPMAVESSYLITKSSNPKVPCIDMLDKHEPPEFSSSYFFYLIMVCINSISDGIAKLSSASRYSDNETAKVVELLQQIDVPLTNCFAALVGGAMDLDLFKTLVKSVQRSAHACGINGLSQQRDNYVKILIQHSYLPEDEQVRKRLLQRSIFCTRALFNLGYALGNKLQGAWSLIVDCVDTLATQINTGFESQPANLLGGTEEYAPIEFALRRLIEQSNDLEDTTIVCMVTALLAKPEFVNFALCQLLISVNSDRFFNSHMWDKFSELALAHMSNREMALPVRLAAMRTVDASCINVMDMANHDDAFKRVVSTLYQQVQIPVSQIQLSAVITLNSLLDQFSAKFATGWEEVFDIISFVSQSDVQTELYRTTFEALELICRDFLENLPYSCIFDLTLCLDQFSRQHVDLNTSFTATALFWPVCDYLIKTSTADGGELSVDSEAQLIEIAKDNQSPLKHYALWLCAQIKLAHIANEPQHQIKTGAIHIFFRLFEAHSRKLPDSVWNACLQLVFPEIMKVQLEGTEENAEETTALIINGLGNIYAANITRSLSGLGPLLDYFSSSTDVIASLYQISALISACAAANVSDAAVEQRIWQFWTAQNTRPEFEPRRSKPILDSLDCIVRLYEKLDPFVRPTEDQVVEAVALVGCCAEYHHANSRISSLQEAVLDQLEYIWKQHAQPKPREAIIAQLSKLSVYCFGDVVTEHYSALSLMSQARLYEFLQESPGNMQQAPQLLEDIVLVLKFSTDRSKAIRIFLHLLNGMTDLAAVSQQVTEGGVSLISGGFQGDSECEAIDEYIAVLEDRNAEAIWPEIVKSLSINALLYERGYYLSSKVLGSDAQIPAEIFGSIELEKASARPDIAYHCLEILQRLSRQLDTAKYFYNKRVEVVLKQNVGDSKLRGREPMSALLRAELLFILQQLSTSTPSSDITVLLYKCINTGDPQVREMIQRILIA